MAETTTWDSDKLCTVSDFNEEFGDSVLSQPSSEGASHVVITGAIKKAGQEISEMLVDILEDIYAQSALDYRTSIPYSQFLQTNNYTFTNLDTILTKVKNPGPMKMAAVTRAGIILLRKKRSEKEFFTADQLVMLNEELKDLLKLFDERYDRGWRALRLDLNSDGAISDFERPRTANSFRRL